jgi:hypothetical protein
VLAVVATEGPFDGIYGFSEVRMCTHTRTHLLSCVCALSCTRLGRVP